MGRLIEKVGTLAYNTTFERFRSILPYALAVGIVFVVFVSCDCIGGLSGYTIAKQNKRLLSIARRRHESILKRQFPLVSHDFVSLRGDQFLDGYVYP